MQYTSIIEGKEKISKLSIGTWAISGRENFGKVDRNEAIQAIQCAIDNGVNHIDTAPVYGNGYAEQAVGEAIRHRRDKVLISTKFGLVPNAFTRMKRDASFQNIIREVESSLQNLKTDHIDYYFVHWPDVNTPLQETMTALNLLKKMGKIRYIAVSNFSIEQIEEARKYADIAVHQCEFSMVNPTNKALIDKASARGIPAFTYGSMGAGILSGKYRTLPNFAADDTRVTFYDYFKEPKFTKIQALLRVMDTVAEKHGKSCAQVALNWNAHYPGVASALCGVTDSKHVKEDCAAFDFQLEEEDLRMLSEAIDQVNG